MNALDEIREHLGADAVLAAPEAMAPFLTDWRGRYCGRALAVLQPRTTAAVAQAVRWCARHALAVVPQGGNTGLVGGATPEATDPPRSIVLSTRRLNRIRRIDTGNDSIVVEAGCALQAVQDAARNAGRLFPLSLAAEGSCTVGGNLATNAGGTQVLRYGNARELALGLEVVLADGTVWDGLRELRKDNTGYDCKQLFIGSEGTLGVITAASLKLFPAPRSQAMCLLGAAGFAATLRLLQEARAAFGAALTGFEIFSGACLDLLVRGALQLKPPFARTPAWCVLVEHSGHEDQDRADQALEAWCARALESGTAQDAVLARSGADCAALWRLRESIPEAQARSGGNVKHDISLPLGRMASFLETCPPALTALDARLLPMIFGHLGDGNLHFNVGVMSGAPPRLAFDMEAAINAIVYAAVRAHGGSVSAEHGLGQLRRDLAQAAKSEVEIGMMRTIKRALDPDNRMNPGKLVALPKESAP